MVRSIIAASSLLAVASAHQNLHQIWVNGVSPGYEFAVRMPPSNSPVTDVTSDDIVCNVNGADVPSGVETTEANEGDEITVGWDPSGHPSPITHFLFGPVDDASKASGIGEGWFKIDEADYTDGSWANEKMEDNGGNYTFTLPTGLQSGDYLLRSEMEALHGAQEIGGAQFYIGCVQLKIKGTGSGSCGPTISLPGAYKAEDDNIYIPDVYSGFDETTFTAPGGPVATCGSGSGSGSGAGSTPSATTKTAAAPTTKSSAAATTSTKAATSKVSSATSSSSSASSPAPTSASATSTRVPTIRTTLSTATSASATPSSPAGGSGSGSGSVAKYGQCGGANYSGATSCASGSKCQKMNDYYSQCV
ncbi:glycosyl hydrolase family 61-domain-containing protein [Xylariomycetidae sp. FL0641]|nr:glycosyl hydrolase family 61-domain-containing protein [Xylariomycetidae sp. FL0641]